MAFNVDYSAALNQAASAGNALSGLGQKLGAIPAQMQAKEKEQQFNALLQSAVGGDKASLDQLYSINPDIAKKIEERGFKLEDRQLEQNYRFKSQKAIDTAGLVEQIHLAPKEQQEAMFNAAVNDDRFDIDEEDRPYFMDPNARKAAITQVKGKDYAESFFGGSGNDKSLPAEAVAFNDLIKDFSPKEKSEARKVKAGLKGRAMSNALLTAIESGDIEAMKKESANMKQAEKFGEMTGSSRAKAIDKGFESINKINSGIGNIDRAIAAVDSGAGVGAVEKLWPSITAASVELDNIRGQMALDVIGSTTFGALSEGELALAKDIALPTGLDSAELKKYLTDKKLAQEKLRDYYNEQVQFLDQGGTVAGFLRSKEKQASTTQNTAPQSNNQDQQALQWAKSNPNDPRSAQILSKLGVK